MEGVCGQPVASFAEERVFVPFSMSRSHFGWTERLAPALAQGYDAEGRPGETFIERYRRAPKEWRDELHRMHPEINDPPAAAGLCSTALDLARFVIEFLLAGKDEGSRLSRGSADRMLEPQVEVTRSVSWGLGWGLHLEG